MSTKTLILMRGGASSGKSTRARELAGDNGVILSTDEFWYKMVDPQEPDKYSFKPHLLSEAHLWNQRRAQKYIEEGHPKVIIDNTNIRLFEMMAYVRYSVPQDYDLQVAEPTSPHWLEIRPLLHDKRGNRDTLQEWSHKLAKLSEATHNVPAYAIMRMLWNWEEVDETSLLMAL